MLRNFELNTVVPLKILTLSMHDAELDISCLGNIVDSDRSQLIRIYSVFHSV